MKIRITYATHADPEPVEIELYPEDYFDPLENAEDTYANAGVPRHLTPYRYTPYSPTNFGISLSSRATRMEIMKSEFNILMASNRI